MPIADSKLGGSYLWVRANSDIKPGSAAPAATEAVQPRQAAAVGMEAAAMMALPHTAATVCTQVGCPPHTMVPTVWCTWVGCAPHGPVGAPAHTPPSNWCSLVGCHPQTQGCTGNPCGAAAAAPAAQAPEAFHAAAGGLQATQILCTQGLATFCGCTPGIDCAGGPAPRPMQTHVFCTQGLATFCGCTPGIEGMAAGGLRQMPNAAPMMFTQWLLCTSTGCIACSQAAAQQAALQPAQTAVTVCFTDCQPPVNQRMNMAAGGLQQMPNTAATVCTQPLGCTFVGCMYPNGVFTPFGR
jgi:hypothetical protein